MDDLDVAFGWPQSPYLAGTWRLAYTSSRTYANNEGLTAYGKDIAGVTTPETRMKIGDPKLAKRIEYIEPVTLEQGSFAALLGKFAGADAVRVEASWVEGRDYSMAVTAQRVIVGDREWQPADRQDKAVRALSAARPVFLDEDLLVMRSNPEYIVWAFTRMPSAAKASLGFLARRTAGRRTFLWRRMWRKRVRLTRTGRDVASCSRRTSRSRS